SKFLHGGLKSAIHSLHAVAKQILKANNEWKSQAAFARFIHDFEQVNGASMFFEWFGDNIPRAIDRKVTVSPRIHIIQRDGGIDIPLGFRHCAQCRTANRKFNRQIFAKSRQTLMQMETSKIPVPVNGPLACFSKSV